MNRIGKEDYRTYNLRRLEETLGENSLAIAPLVKY
jgi:hypothetical protein